MRERIKLIFWPLFIAIGAIGLYFMLDSLTVRAEDGEVELLAGHATAYTITGKTASGQYTRPGIAAAKKDWIGKTVILYQRLPDDSVGEVIGTYEILDTGGTKGIKGGKVIDIWQPSDADAQEFMNRVYENGCKGHIYFQLIDAEG